MYEYFRDFAGPIATMVQNVILAAGAYVAWCTIQSNRKISAQRATLDVINQLASDEQYRDALRQINIMKKDKRDTGTIWSDLNDPAKASEKDACRTRYRSAQYVLNRLAIIANGIKSGTLDEQSFKEHYYSTYVETVSYLHGFIHSVREEASERIKRRKYVSHETVYSELDWLLERWKLHPLSGDLAQRDSDEKR